STPPTRLGQGLVGEDHDDRALPVRQAQGRGLRCRSSVAAGATTDLAVQRVHQMQRKPLISAQEGRSRSSPATPRSPPRSSAHAPWEHVDSHLATDGIELSADVLDRIDEIVPPDARSTSRTTGGASARQRWTPPAAAGGATAPGRSDVNSPRNRRTWSGEQQFDANGGIAGGYLAVERYQRGVASLGKGCQVVN